MTTELIEKEIARFLESPDAEVICLRGKWGIGKTYGWKAFLRDAQKKKRLALKTYSYVSLFGLDSLDQVRYAIFENSVATNIVDAEPSLETLHSNAASIAASLGRKSWSILQLLPKVKDFSAVVQSLSFLSVRKSIVCIDDLERKGSHLPTRDVLGLISMLKEERKCKVVLILNSDELEGKDKEEFEKYGEKVIDASLEFDPSPTDSVRIAVQGDSDVGKWTASNCVALRISNIRIIKKIERLVTRLQPLLKGLDERVLKQAAQSVALLAWAVHSADDAFLNFIEKRRGRGRYGTTKTEELSDEEKAWDALLDEYSFRTMDELDQVLLDGIRVGFFDEVRLKTAADQLNAQFKSLEGEQTLERAWALFHDSFDDNEQDLIKAIYETFEDHVQLITPLNLNGTVRLLKDLGYAEGAGAAIGHYMEHRDEKREFFDLEKNPFGDEVTDPDVRKAFSEKLETFKNTRMPAEVLIRMAKEHSWLPEDITLLTSLSPQDLYALFKAHRGSDLSRIIQACLQFDRIVNADLQMRAIASNAKEALKMIGAESDLNRRRVRKYGIEIQDNGS